MRRLSRIRRAGERREAIAEKKAEKIRGFSIKLEFGGGDIDN